MPIFEKLHQSGAGAPASAGPGAVSGARGLGGKGAWPRGGGGCINIGVYIYGRRPISDPVPNQHMHLEHYSNEAATNFSIYATEKENANLQRSWVWHKSYQMHNYLKKGSICIYQSHQLHNHPKKLIKCRSAEVLGGWLGRGSKTSGDVHFLRFLRQLCNW